MHMPTQAAQEAYEPWYKYGVAFLTIEMVIAIAVSAYSLFHDLSRPGRLPRQTLRSLLRRPTMESQNVSARRR